MIQNTPSTHASAPVRLCLLPDAPDADGAPRVGLLVPTMGRRPVLRLFASLAAALSVKAQMEASR